MRIVAISVSKLFGIFDHFVPLFVDQRITIVHAANGHGKTTLLQMVNDVFSGRLINLGSISFEEFEISFDDGGVLSITRGKVTSPLSRARRELLVKLTRGREVLDATISTAIRTNREIDLDSIDAIIPNLARTDQFTWEDLATGESLSVDEVMRRYEPILRRRTGRNKQPAWLSEVCSSVKVRLVESQRLLRSSRGRPYQGANGNSEPAVSFYSAHIAKEISKRLGEYANTSQVLDQTFPMRLVAQLEKAATESLSIQELQARIKSLDELRSRLKVAGLLEKEEGTFALPRELQESVQKFLPLYISDVETKLKVFAGLLEKIELLKKIVSQRFKYKTIFFDKKNGFSFKNGEELLQASTLSSGEQHLLVLWSELLFMVEPNAMVLIDEPEISLHVAWQQDFLRELEEIIELSHFDALIATHSPQVINEHWDLTVELEGPEWVH